jgi:hypothetical protein
MLWTVLVVLAIVALIVSIGSAHPTRVTETRHSTALKPRLLELT